MRAPYGFPAMLGYNPFTGAGGDSAITGGGSGYRAEVLADSPTHYYLLDELSGTTLDDSVGSTDLTINGVHTLGEASLAGDAGTSIDFEGTADATGASLGTIGFPYTLECLLNLDAVTSSSSIFIGTSQLQSVYAGFNLRYTNNGTINTLIGDGGGTTSANRVSHTTTATISNSTTTHLAAVFTSLTDVKIYFNGVSQTVAKTGTGTSVGGFTGIPMICRDRIANGYLRAKLDHVALYDTALTAARLLAHTQAAGL